MKLFAFVAAATVALATTASAMAPTQLEVRAQSALDKHGFSVDAGDLSAAKWYAITDAVDNENNNTKDVRENIASILRR